MPYHPTNKIKIKIQEKRRNCSKYIGIETKRNIGIEKNLILSFKRGCGASAAYPLKKTIVHDFSI